MTWMWWGGLVLALAAVVGITARRLGQTRARLARAEARLATVLEGWEAGLSVWESGGRLVGWNPRFGEFYPEAPLKPGVVFEDLIRYTANRGLVQLAADDDDAIEKWVTEHVARFGTAHTEVLRTGVGAVGRPGDADDRDRRGPAGARGHHGGAGRGRVPSGRRAGAGA